MNIPRLKHLITILERVPPEHFDLREWKCGTTCCAVGWAAQDPQFNAEGLTLWYTPGRFYEPILTGPEVEAATFRESLHAFGAVSLFFGLTIRQSYHLFLPSYYYPDRAPTPQDVIARINDLIARQRREDDELAAQLEDIEQAQCGQDQPDEGDPQ